jgi:hypothetical protein
LFSFKRQRCKDLHTTPQVAYIVRFKKQKEIFYFVKTLVKSRRIGFRTGANPTTVEFIATTPAFY